VRVLDLFSGIGGFSLGLERTGGFETVAFCEIEDYPRKVLAKHWPGVPIYGDVRTLTAERLAADGITGIDVITGGFPCQDLSVAGKQAGMGEGTRSGLWSEIARLIGELRPRYAIVENVTALLSGDRGRWFGRVLGDLASLGYDAEWHCVKASDIGAWHHRDRVWVVCYPASIKRDGGEHEPIISRQMRKIWESGGANFAQPVSDAYPARCWESYQAVEGESSEQFNSGDIQPGENPVPYANSAGLQRGVQDRCINQEGWEIQKDGRATKCGDWRRRSGNGIWASEPAVGRVANGIPNRAHRLKGLGNAVVPQIPELIGRAIMDYEANHR